MAPIGLIFAGITPSGKTYPEFFDSQGNIYLFHNEGIIFFHNTDVPPMTELYELSDDSTDDEKLAYRDLWCHRTLGVENNMWIRCESHKFEDER